MLKIHCTGTPREIGYHHGVSAKTQIRYSLSFYERYFIEKAGIFWEEARAVASEFLPLLRSEEEWREMVEEMRGIAAGAEVTFGDILALNVRTEISMGMMDEGCTSLSWCSDSNPSRTVLAQNWDWDPRQQRAIIQLTISRPSRPTITMMTEAGLIGKIGISSAGFGVCLNAIRARGVNSHALPVHLALRAVLNSKDRLEAARKLGDGVGVASACFILIADCRGCAALECSHRDMRLWGGEGHFDVHANHFLAQHALGVKEAVDVTESKARVVRIRELIEEAKAKGVEPGREVVEKMLEDEKGLPCAINRKVGGESSTQTLFGIVMEFEPQKGKAWVRMGRPTEGGETAEIEFSGFNLLFP